MQLLSIKITCERYLKAKKKEKFMMTKQGQKFRSLAEFLPKLKSIRGGGLRLGRGLRPYTPDTYQK